MASVAELNVGANALKTYVDGIMNDAGEGWEENFIPSEFYVTGCTDIINAADRGTQKPASRQANGSIALRNAVQSSGYSSRISDTQIVGAVQVVCKPSTHFGKPIMNSDALKSMFGQVTTAVLAILVATGVMSGDDSKSIAGALTTLFTSISAAIPAVLLLVNLAASAYRHYGMKKVPEKAVALELPASAPPAPSVGQKMDLGPLKGQAKVVG